MKKLVYGGLFLLIIGVVMYGCKKETLPGNQNQTENAEAERLFIENLTSEIENVKEYFVETKSSSVDPTFPTNPFDAVGVEHNVQLAAIHNHSGFVKDAETTLQIFNSNHRESTGKPIITDLEDALSSTTDFISAVIQNGELNYNWINSLNIPFLEKGTLTLYFQTMYSTDNIQLRVALSKVMEVAVKNSWLFNSASKERLLTTFAIFRHSTVYWSDFDGYAGLSSFSEAVDALVAEWCMDGTIAPSGYDVSCPGVANQIGSAVSAVFDVLFRF
jgi:hypothetical protein